MNFKEKGFQKYFRNPFSLYLQHNIPRIKPLNKYSAPNNDTDQSEEFGCLRKIWVCNIYLFYVYTSAAFYPAAKTS